MPSPRTLLLVVLVLVLLLAAPVVGQSATRMELDPTGRPLSGLVLPTTGPGAEDPAPPLDALLRGGPTGRRRILLTGYWPPSNEAIRKFSTSLTQNPQGWKGNNWEQRGYDIYSFFPEFDPRDCSNCGKGTGDLEVDYQDTSVDFWAIANSIQPTAIITFSRGFLDRSWELEMNQFNRSSWIADFQAPVFPTPSPPDASVPAGFLRTSTLPTQAIVDAVDASALDVNPYICFSGDGGGFLSEFMAYHGVWYQSLHTDPNDPAHCVAAGHVHVGGNLEWFTAIGAAEISVRTLIDHVNGILGPPGGLVTTCGVGGVNAGCGTTENILRVNGSRGGNARTVFLSPTSSLEISVDEPSGQQGDGSPTRLCVYAFPGLAGAQDDLLLPRGLGRMCFGPFALASQPPLVTWNSIGRTSKLGPHTAPGPPPLIPDGGTAVLISLASGAGMQVTLTLQGIVEDACTQALVPFSVTNGVAVKIE